MDTKLNFINRSSSDNLNIVIYQRNPAEPLDLSTAWMVIPNSQPGWSHPFTFPSALEVGATDSYGNNTFSRMSAKSGELFHVGEGHTGMELSLAGPAMNKKNIEVRNNLSRGSVDINIYRDGKLLGSKTNVSPAQKASFCFNKTLWIGVVEDVQEGSVLNQAIQSQITRRIPLLGIHSADIVLTGGGSGTKTTPFKFRLQHVKRA